ncbi:hypothetical protein [Streptomyces sp. TLI_105]|uniref:hypothetical protein n=1 Tax=Streptomyces sp. TLI_105 TaxID=1881019 RepID=UPI00089B1E75|nr:hypothetical protein [Streptomyces sp. TLI_105]SEE57565.1 hypothetical protein SAMN05428939_7943 [Streptomyces sp. TLI_105]
MTTINLATVSEAEPSPRANPFPGADTYGWTQSFSEALALATGLPPLVTDVIAPYVIRPKRYLTRAKTETFYRLRPGVIVKDERTGLHILSVTTHGFAGTPTEYNERVRSAFHSPAQFDASPDRVLPRLTTGSDPSGTALPFVTTAEPVEPTILNNLLGIMDGALTEADHKRGYDLAEDMTVFGQTNRTMHVPFVRTITENHQGVPVIRTVVDLVAIKGSNRSRARLKLHGLTARNIAFGVPTSKLDLPDPKPGQPAPPEYIADPVIWAPAFADTLRNAFADPKHRLHDTAQAAAEVATVQMQIIVGTDNPAEFHNTVFDPNRADHRRPQLDYPLAEKSTSDMRAVLREAKTSGRITEPVRAWLAGEDSEPGTLSGSVTDARDRRDRALLGIAFPKELEHDREVARVLGEPERYYDSREENVTLRLRMLSAAIAEGYRNRWNPRLLDGTLYSSFIAKRGTLAGRPDWRTALDQAETDKTQLSDFLVTRGLHWLAEHGMVEADRGSADGQRGPGRRSGVSARNALLLKPVQAIALMREIARANDVGTSPRQIDETGAPVDGTVADRTWFSVTFPKTGRGKKKGDDRPSASDSTPPQQPKKSPEQVLLDAQLRLVTSLSSDLPQSFLGALAVAREAIVAGAAVGKPVLADLPSYSVEVMEQALTRLKRDLGAMQAGLADMKVDTEVVIESATEQAVNAEGEQ